ncbi:MAG TPA: 50S ribosomal protein L3 [Firmicutes bacterium]|nr:50S ribosomal protein L3 [Bacillota bacterium]HHY98478.1 50S ribosomal protein L3 [Bacillota bacterium]
MAKGILGKKVGMTRIFDENGVITPVTAIEAGPCQIVQKKTRDRDGYDAIQLGFGTRSQAAITKPVRGHLKKAGIEQPVRYLKEIRVDNPDQYNVGQTIKADIFQEGEMVDVTGTTIGKGFTGVVKRWNFNRGPMSHGSMYHRRVGSLGATDPQRVFKGRRMPGRMGAERVTIQKLRIVKVDPEKNLILVKGSVPGTRGSLLTIRESVKKG